MLRLASTLYSIIATSLAGTAVIGVLVTGHDTAPMIVGAAAFGALAAVPVAYVVARKILAL
ncbi:hypothetical protein ACS3SW_00855 [Roseobacteraceae bacterium S113]